MTDHLSASARQIADLKAQVQTLNLRLGETIQTVILLMQNQNWDQIEIPLESFQDLARAGVMFHTNHVDGKVRIWLTAKKEATGLVDVDGNPVYTEPEPDAPTPPPLDQVKTEGEPS